jgi:glycerophosphoryl diester phosphodiesterase
MPSLSGFLVRATRRFTVMATMLGSGGSGMAAPAPAPEPDAEPPALALLRSPRPLVIAHRGFSTAAPENTLPAFRLALDAEADLVELDFRQSRDGELVVLHDATLDRTTDAVIRWQQERIRVADRDWAELQTLEVAPSHPLGLSQVRLPRLAEAIEAIRPGAVPLIERKAGPAADVVDLLRQRGWINHVVLQAFDWEFLRDVHRLEPGQVLGALGPPPASGPGPRSDADEELTAAHLDTIQLLGARYVGWNRRVSRERVQDAHRRGLKVWIYTINDPAEARELLARGVDGVITDNPARLWKTLATAKP